MLLRVDVQCREYIDHSISYDCSYNSAKDAHKDTKPNLPNKGKAGPSLLNFYLNLNGLVLALTQSGAAPGENPSYSSEYSDTPNNNGDNGVCSVKYVSHLASLRGFLKTAPYCY